MINVRKGTFCISVVLAILLVYASAFKIWSFIRTDIGFDFFPFVKYHHRGVFWGLVVVQGIFAASLLFKKTRLIGLYSIFFLLTSLSTYLYVMLRYADHIPCFCKGIIPGMSWEGHLWFSVGIAILTGIAIALLPNYKAK